MKKDMVKRDNQEMNQFVRLTTTTFFDERLTDSGCRLLIAILNNAEDWKVNVTYYGNKFGWSSGKTTRAKKNLMEYGYLKEDVEMTSNGKVYHYTIRESLQVKEKSLHSISNSWKPKVDNQALETNEWKQSTNNSNKDNINPDKNKVDKKKERKSSVSVGVSTPLEIASKEANKKDTHTSLQSKDDFFFAYGERPTEEKMITYVVKQGYSREVGSEIFLELHNKDFKNKQGTPIKGIERYINSMLKDKSKHTHHTSIESFMETVKQVNEAYIKNSIKTNQDKPIDFQTSLLYGKEASKEYWSSISKNKNDYIQYMLDFIESNNGYKPMSSFKAHVMKHRDRQIQNAGTSYV